MQQTNPDTQLPAGDARQWQIKWGTKVLLQAGDAIRVRAFGQLEVGAGDPQRLVDFVSAPDGQELTEMARNRVKEMAVQAVQAALEKCTTLPFPEREGACPHDYVAQVTDAISADLQGQLAAMGLALCTFVIMGCSYEPLNEASSRIDGGEDSPGTWARRIQLGEPVESIPESVRTRWLQLGKLTLGGKLEGKGDADA